MQGIRAFESEFRFYVGVVSTTDIYFLHLYSAGLDDSAGISVISHVISQLLVQISIHFSTISEFGRSQILAIKTNSPYFSADSFIFFITCQL